MELNYQGGIYGIYNQETLLYIGKTTMNFKERFSAHQRKLEDKNSTEEIYQYCRNNNITKVNLSFKILYDCKDCPLSNEQLECLETNYINKFQPLYNTKKLNQVDTIISLQKENFPQLNKQQQEILLFYYNHLSKSAFGLLIGFLMFEDMNAENYKASNLQTKFNIGKTCFYDAIKEIKTIIGEKNGK